MRRPLMLGIAAVLSVSSLAIWPTARADATLAVGDHAPSFTAQAAQGGRQFPITLQNLLRRGPVVVYFFPRAFTQGCTIESRAFAEAIPQFRAAGATVIGISADDVPTLQRFSTEECRGAFPMASATPQLLQQFDVQLREGMSSRTSYVIGRDGRIVLVHSDMNPNDHVRQTLAAVQDIKARATRRR